jgi:perosamine synthetase
VIRLARPDIDAGDIAAVAAVLESGALVQGPYVREFEAAVAVESGVPHAIAVSNCTAALHLALMAIGVGPGDAVAIPTFSWLATANVVALVGAEPVFVDIERESFGMDPAALGRTLAGNKRVKAVIVVHALGLMADMVALSRIAAEYSVPLLEDAACALGARADDRPAGAWGTAACFSFHPRKAITTGEGGMVVSSDATIARRVRILRNHGLDPDATSPEFIDVGYNLRMTEFQAVLGVRQMRRLRGLIDARRIRAARYAALLAGSAVTPPNEPARRCHVFQTYAVLLPPELAAIRPDIIRRLRERGIETNIATHHMPLTTYFRTRGHYTRGDFPVTDDVAGRALALPMHSHLSDEDQERVVDALRAQL